eukprot:CAMPEP_0195636788 /NCGR_PEP_ID=MMETSP0815-20121206/24059_1 /TAXON_ID=97485 /ORGANISM="Prymnesium parvum, Strain Texoma1" /LENGTH=32 /DNA_ID= /DNA_START= /DNA_END= /DNA_ORIENTATION=
METAMHSGEVKRLCTSPTLEERIQPQTTPRLD